MTIIDAKTGRPGPAHAVQVMIYMYALPRVFSVNYFCRLRQLLE